MQANFPSMSKVDGCNLTAAGVHSCICPDGHRLHVRDTYPPVQDLQPRVLFVVFIFVLCFIVGICGNASVLIIIRGIVSEQKYSSGNFSTSGGSTRARKSSDNAILYIAALCCVDFLMSLSLPPVIMDNIIGFWMFRTWVCKLHHLFGSVGRIVSTFIITAMSFDRFVAVCYPHKTQYRSRRFVLCTIVSLWSAGFVLLLPMLTYAKANEMFLRQMRQVDPLTGEENITRVRVYKCSDMMPTAVFYWFTCSTFVLGYLVPLVLIVYFNSRLVSKLYHGHGNLLRKSSVPRRRISVYIILIAAFYFLCWTPYWCSVLYAIYMSLFFDETGRSTSELLLFIIYCVHLLPYIGSASNWILYGLLNTHLQMRHHQYSLNHFPLRNNWETSPPRVASAPANSVLFATSIELNKAAASEKDLSLSKSIVADGQVTTETSTHMRRGHRRQGTMQLTVAE